MLCYDTLIEISKYSNKQGLLNFLSTCKDYRYHISIYHNKYAFKLNHSQKTIQNDLQSLRRIIQEQKRIITYQKSFQLVKYALHDRTEWLKCNEPYNEQFRNIYNIKKLFIGNRYNQPILIALNNGTFFNPFLKSTLTTLILGNDFNQEIDHFLPQTLRKLILGNKYNNPVTDLPYNLEVLILGNSFNQSVDSLPPNLKVLQIGNGFCQSFEKLPDSLESLSINSHIGLWARYIGRLPSSLKKLHLRILYDVESFPNNLETIECGRCYQNALIKLPDTLKHFSCKWFDRSYGFRCLFPKSLKTLTIDTIYHDDILPDGVEKIRLTKYMSSNAFKLPSMLKHLSVMSMYRYLPKPVFEFNEGLKILSIMVLSSDIKDLPSTLEYLRIDEYTNNNPITSIPSCLKILDLRTMNHINYFLQLDKLYVIKNHPQINTLKQMYGRKLKYRKNSYIN